MVNNTTGDIGRSGVEMDLTQSYTVCPLAGVPMVRITVRRKLLGGS